MVSNGFDCCASSRTEKAKESTFDKLLLDGFSRVASKGLLRSQTSSLTRRTVEGNLGLVLQHSPDHFANKRKSSGHKDVVMPVDPEVFNFNKVAKEEIVGVVEDAAGFAVTVIPCGSPLAIGHMLLVPRRDVVAPQVMTTEFLRCGLDLMARTIRKDFRLLFNSLLGLASVNHFHYHGMYLDYCGFASGSRQFPVERVERSTVGGGRTEGKVCVELLAESQWYCRGLVVTAGCKVGMAGEPPPGDIEALATFAGNIIGLLQSRNVPHNVMIAPYQGERKPRQNEDIFAEETWQPLAASPEVYIFPRKPEDECREDGGFNAAICEISGLITCHNEDSFQQFDEDKVSTIFKQDVSLAGDDFDDLICKVAWMVS
ncbi:gdpgp1 [Symbiodinium natans]|uniref:GDP-D-glucose phosphorylase 1 n=1 Tax=Symbiodinium natans TaxID=878477 RepID=A0A812KDE0_9DINO|nr:gdpgp1 [Symbiodinium natans]